LKEDTGECVQVGTCVHGQLIDLLGCCVVNSSYEQVRSCDAPTAPNFSSNTEVGQVQVLTVDEKVGWIDIPVDKAVRVGRVESCASLTQECDAAVQRHGSFPLHDRAKI
jgi:hypothetical protein